MLIFSAELVFGPEIWSNQYDDHEDLPSHMGCPTNCANDTGAAELRGRVVFGVEAGEPLNTSAAIFLMEK
jgi:hypothetical protein